MKRDHYVAMINFCRARPFLLHFTTLLCRALPWLVSALYATCAFRLAFSGDHRLLLYLALPFFVLVLTSLLPHVIPRQRPYEIYDFEPLLPHEGGASFPSRHSASAAIIALATCRLSLILGLLSLVLALVIGLTRIVSGVHALRDVVGGFALAFAAALAAFFLF